MAGLHTEEVLAGRNGMSGFKARPFGWMLLLCLWITGSSLAVRLSSLPSFHQGGSESIVARLLGRSASAAAEYSLAQADVVFHGGRPRYRALAFDDNPFQILWRQIASTGHIHLEGAAVGEALPWLQMATRLDPHNVEYSLIASFLLLSEIKKPKEAMKVLLEAQANNPDAYLVQMGKCRLFAKMDNRVMSRRACDRALELWPSGGNPNDDEVRLDKRELLARRAVLKELDGDIHGSIEDMRSIVQLFPERRPLQFVERIAILERGDKPADTAESRWNALRNEEFRHLCQEGDSHGDERGRSGSH